MQIFYSFPLIFSNMQKHKRPIGTLVKYMIDVTMGMHYLSEKGLLHRVRN